MAILVSERSNGRKRVQLICNMEECKTEQKFKDECDINWLVNKYDPRTLAEMRSKTEGQYGFVDSQSFQDAMYIVAKADQMFDQVPSQIRKRFENNPAQFLEFVQNPDNAEELVKMGLARNREDIASKVTQEQVFRVIKEGIDRVEAGPPGRVAGNEPASSGQG